MRSRFAIALCLCLLAALALAVAGCGAEEESEGHEGEPLEIGELSYNVQITRFLNPADNEDSEYLVGQPEAPPDEDYLGVFLVIENETDEAQPSADSYTIIDQVENEYEPVESESPYALDIGADVPAHEQIPIPDTTPFAGFNKGALLIFKVDATVTENRPLTLEIEDGANHGAIVLDI